MDPLRHVKPAVRALKAYTLAEQPAAVKINQNENPWDLPEPLKRRVLERALARPWSRYPAFDPLAQDQPAGIDVGLGDRGVFVKDCCSRFLAHFALPSASKSTGFPHPSMQWQ